MSDRDGITKGAGFDTVRSLADESVETHREPGKKESLFAFLKELPLLIVAAVVIASLIKWLVVQPFEIPSPSMEPTLVPGDRVLVSKFIYRFVKPKPGGIIVFVAPDDGRDFIKRIVAVGGDEVEIKEGMVYVNSSPIIEEYDTMPGDLENWGPKEIPKNSVFVMGDNRPNSFDGRRFGPVPQESILGKAFLIYWPISRLKLLN